MSYVLKLSNACAVINPVLLHPPRQSREHLGKHQKSSIYCQVSQWAGSTRTILLSMTGSANQPTDQKDRFMPETLLQRMLSRIRPKSRMKHAHFNSEQDLAQILDYIDDIKTTLLRSQIANKWSTVDMLLKHFPRSSQQRICPLCEYAGPAEHYKTVHSHCIFGGGDLARYICPCCDVIFGPDKMFDLTENELSEDYRWHYTAYREGDSTESELRAFFALKPDKSGMYLNYGAGAWSSSVQKLRSEGWNVYAYEPFSMLPADRPSWAISSLDSISAKSLDGLYSNNVLEHLRHPSSELKLMTKLLKDNGCMAHATPCYEYSYEYTRFHLYFYQGNSLQSLMDKSGLEIISEDINGTYNCKVMRLKQPQAGPYQSPLKSQ